MRDMELAIDKVIAGPEKKTRIISNKEKEVTAYHEVGHALMCILLPNANPLHKVTIIPRGFALGLTMSYPEEDILSHTRSQLVDQIGVCLGGRVAEELVFGEMTTGAQNDLEKSTSLARRMTTEFGMSEKLGPMTFGKRNDQPFMGRDFGHERDYSENIAQLIDQEVSDLISSQYTRVKDAILNHRPHMDAIVKELLEKETLDRKDVDAIMDEVNRQLAGGVSPSVGGGDSGSSGYTMGDGTTINIGPEGDAGSCDQPSDINDGKNDGPKPEFKPKFA